MNDTRELLAGKVRVRRLPVFAEGGPPTAVGPKRLLLSRGELAQFYCSEQPVRTLTYLELLTGMTRGNHYHKVRDEFIYVLRGEIRLTCADIVSQAGASVVLEAGDLVFMEREVAHAFTTQQDGHAIEFAAALFDPADTYRYEVIGGPGPAARL